jgi:predicted nucleic acid-binding protein
MPRAARRVRILVPSRNVPLRRDANRAIDEIKEHLEKSNKRLDYPAKKSKPLWASRLLVSRSPKQGNAGCNEEATRIMSIIDAEDVPFVAAA